ncbi:hypothetical protein SAMN05216323_100369 [Williamwhitmania taraxaci]|uniref:Uncharacterized protein n=1 Tax=Williamwhitmania taraxaci TaxID=1640674 RepID=A0A1G6GU30_9BACT|nr:hypothetical protein SAMN05216323_100369 [Williamwhitmania taraxaci]
MKNYAAFLILLLSISIVGCEKISTADDGSLYGSWKVRLDVPPYTTYLVNIEREYAGIDTTVFVFNNFQNRDDMVFCKLNDSTLTIWNSSEVTGTGVYHKSERKINWAYTSFSNSTSTPIYATYTKN